MLDYKLKMYPLILTLEISIIEVKVGFHTNMRQKEESVEQSRFNKFA